MIPQLYQQVSHDIRITVCPVHAAEHSDESVPRHVFVYMIRIENRSERTVQLLRRHWHIHDALAGDSEVEGEGVVGEQPVLAPGEFHEYQSYCVLRGRRGHMAGTYRFRRTDGVEFDADIPRFELNAEEQEG